MRQRFDHIDYYAEQALAQATHAALRHRAVQAMQQYGFPALKTESWKYTSSKSLLNQFYSTAETISVSPEQLTPWILPETERVVLVNGVYCSELSTLAVDADATKLGAVVNTEHTGFTALNTAVFSQACCVHLSASVNKPVHILHVATNADEAMIASRVFLELAPAIEATVFEQFVALDDSDYWRNSVTEITLAEGSQLQYAKLQQEAALAKHTHFIGVEQQNSSVFKSMSLDLGGRLARNDVQTKLLAEHARSELNGVYLGGDKQHVDNHTTIEHLCANTQSQEHYKGILTDQAHGVFNGRVLVVKDAQKVDSSQQNANLLLSKSCEIDTKPELEIYADDVKCAHGATVGQLDEQALFYLQARGLDLELAKQLLTYGFAFEVLEALEQPSLHAVFQQALVDWFAHSNELQGLLA